MAGRALNDKRKEENENITMRNNMNNTKRWPMAMASFIISHLSFKSKAALLSLVICHLSFIPAGAQTQLSRYQPGVTPEGAVYFLPKTALRVSVLVEKVTYTPGDFSPYAQRYLRIAGVEQEPSVSFRVVAVRQTAVPVPDTSKVYAVKFDARTVASRMTLSEDGRLLALNVEDAADVSIPAPFVAAPRPAPVNPRSFLSEEILSCGSTAKMAELTAHEIYDLRENRSLLIKGQADFMPKDGQQLKIMLDELDAQDKALSSLFVGTTERDTTEHILWATPDGAFPRQVLFRLSQVYGLVDADDLSGAPYYISVDDLTQLPAVVEAPKKGGLGGLLHKKGEAGIYVNVPGRMRSTIYEGITPLLSEEFPAPQLGRTQLLGASLFNKRYTTRLLLNPLTGAIERLDADQPK